MNTQSHTVESCLMLLSDNSLLMKEQDKNLISSLAQQIDRRTGLTDRQLRLARKKLDEYRTELEQYDVDVDSAKQRTSLDVRYIDRSRWIRLEQSEDGVSILVRFVYQRNLIRRMEDLARLIPQDQRTYDPETKTHSIDYSESNLYEIVHTFRDCGFDIDPEVMLLYQELCDLDPETVVPGVYDKQLKNLPPAGQQLIEQELGEVDEHSLALYRDRSIRYGLHYFDSKDLNDSLENYSYLAGRIANRSSASVVIENTRFSMDTLVLALEELNRLPLLIVLPAQLPESLVEIHKSLKNIVAPEETAVMFRLDNEENSDVNQWIRDNNLNNPLDSHKKIVYTIDARIPKPILNSEWEPQAVLSFSHSSLLVSVKKILNFYSDSDLIIYYEDSEGSIVSQNSVKMERIE